MAAAAATTTPATKTAGATKTGGSSTSNAGQKGIADGYCYWAACRQLLSLSLWDKTSGSISEPTKETKA
eukprot:5108697-Prorocentrum_lima.AAC.1